MYISWREKGVLINFKIITNELNEDTKILIQKVEAMESEINKKDEEFSSKDDEISAKDKEI